MLSRQESIQGLLGGLLKNRQLLPSMRRVMVMRMWEQVVGGVVAEKSWPEKVVDGVLKIGVTTHAWVEELNLIKPQIIARYRQLLGRSALKDVEFRVARRKARPEEKAAISLRPLPGQTPPLQHVPLQLFDGVTNPEVRSLLTPAFARLRAERERKRDDGWGRCTGCHRIIYGAQCPNCGGKPEAA